jgi:hypothetical protein
MLHPQLTKRIWADEKYSPLTTVVPEDHHSFVSRSWDAILDFLFDKTKKNNDAFFFFESKSAIDNIANNCIYNIWKTVASHNRGNYLDLG